MVQFIVKTIVSALIIASVSTISKKAPLFGAIIISLPLTSILALIWLYVDTKDSSKLLQLSNSITIMLIPSVIFFIALSLLIKNNVKIHYALIISSLIMIVSYSLYTLILSKIGIKI